MINVRLMKKQDDLLDYSKDVLAVLFEGRTRHSGLPYMQEHLIKVANIVDLVVSESKYKRAAVAGALWHDGPEDIEGLDVYDPFNPPRILDPDQIYMNDLLGAAQEVGTYVCYLVHLLTDRGGFNYYDYVANICNLPKNGLERDLHILAAVIKAVDIRLNSDPNEKRSYVKSLKDYRNHKGDSLEELADYYKNTRVVDAFIAKGDYHYDEDLFLETIQARSEQRVIARAINNLALYLPMLDYVLASADANGKLFHATLFRGILRDAYKDSYKVFRGAHPDFDWPYIKMLGLNERAPVIDGYLSVRKELRIQTSGTDEERVRYGLKKLVLPGIDIKQFRIKPQDIPE
ncbi:hypothetical protein JW711_04030 [Candidatus Woesearchaeota archaeon]|nr:hypothetical protein [Candidatus Woesearchaeota archaeon]